MRAAPGLTMSLAPMPLLAPEPRPAAAPADRLLARVTARAARVGIVGLGYVGLPLARAFAENGFPVLGFDVDPEKVEKLQRGESYIGHIPSGVVRALRERRFEATSHFERLGEVDAVVVCVPTPLTEAREPDLSYVVASAR